MSSDNDRVFHREMARDHVNQIKETLICASCGTPNYIAPVEFHNKEHDQYPGRRVSALVAQGRSRTIIDREIKRCTPLCRSCHMKLDGRTEALHKVTPHQKGYRKPVERCRFCNELYKPLRKGLCNSCYKCEYIAEWPSYPIVCRNGHYKLGSNVYVSPKGQRNCIQCKIDRDNKPFY
jgi:hypothetical protein